MKHSTISLCVPTYNRVDTLRQLIHSFQLQDYKYKELVVSDDSTNDDVSNLVTSYKSKNIRYFRNNPPLGFPKNLLASILRAKGDYLITLGDDDVLFSPKTLSRYVDVFDSHPDVHFIYSNQIQFNSDGNIEANIIKFKEDTLFEKGSQGLTNMFLHSIFIGGQGFRRKTNFKSLYPEKNILHPQVQLVGSILAQHKSYGISDLCIGVRSHSDQIIFRALKNKKIQLDGDHMNIELPKIYRFLRKKYKFKNDEDVIIKQLIDNYPPIIIKEKMYLGNLILRKYFYKFCSLSSKAQKSKKLKAIYYTSLLTPSILLASARFLGMRGIQLFNYSLFKIQKNKLKKILN